MPTTPTYPGVYIEEVPSEVRTITGVSTSVTAFAGYTKKGPINKAEEVLSFADFERKFGGLDRDSLMSYAVQHFFMNGGQGAYVVRLTQENTARAASVTLQSLASAQDVLKVTARGPGAWANGMVVTVDYETAHPDSTFNLRVVDPVTGRSEAFLGVTMNTNSRRNVDKVVEDTSQLIHVETEDAAPSSVTGRGESRSGKGISHTAVDADHCQFMITLDEDDGPQLVTIYDGSEANKPVDLVELALKIRDAVYAIDPSREPYRSFACTPENVKKMLTLTSGYDGDKSFVRVTSAGSLDAARVLKLGVANGGREIDAVADIRPAPMGTTSGDLEQIPTLDQDRKILVTIDGDGPHEVPISQVGDPEPSDLEVLRQLLQKKLQAIKPNQPGSMAFMGISSKVVGSTIQILSGSTDANSLVRIENDRILTVLNDVFVVSTDNGWAVGDAGAGRPSTSGIRLPRQRGGEDGDLCPVGR
jgi:hypothetical protein